MRNIITAIGILALWALLLVNHNAFAIKANETTTFVIHNTVGGECFGLANQPTLLVGYPNGQCQAVMDADTCHRQGTLCVCTGHADSVSGNCDGYPGPWH